MCQIHAGGTEWGVSNAGYTPGSISGVDSETRNHCWRKVSGGGSGYDGDGGGGDDGDVDCSGECSVENLQAKGNCHIVMNK